MSLRIKICGITNANDALSAADAGADALGFICYRKSPRYVRPSQAVSIIRELPPFVSKVGVFVNATEEEVRSAILECGFDVIQFHGEETPEFCLSFRPLKIIKAFRMGDAASLKALGNFSTDAWLLDSFVPGQRGGTGAAFNWDLAIQAKGMGRPVILAGGLQVDNVAQAVRQVRPYGLDVSSGVESAPGKKDRVRMTDFVAAARDAFRKTL